MIWSAIASVSSDRILLPLFELGLAAAVAYTMFRAFRARARVKAGEISLNVERGEQSQHILSAVYYYGVFAVVFFIPLSVQTSHHKVLWSLFNTFAATYLCFFGGWSRLKIFELVTRFSKVQEWA